LKKIIPLFVCFQIANPVCASDILEKLSTTIENPDSVKIMIPTIAWHNRFMYDIKDIDGFNEWPLGFGLGIGKRHNGADISIMAVGLNDSNYHFQAFWGYAYERAFIGNVEKWHASIGYSITIQHRYEYSYLPIPIPLPVVGFGYGGSKISATYIPGTYGHLNALFAWVSIAF
jgi:palmitoyl transferase